MVVVRNLFNYSLIASFFPLALGIFVSVSLLPLFHLLILASFTAALFLSKSTLNRSLPASVWVLLVYILVQILSGVINLEALQKPVHAIGSVKYPLIGLIGVFLFQNFKLKPEHLRWIKYAAHLFLFSIIAAFIYGFFKVYFNYDLKTGLVGVYEDRLCGFTDIMRYGYGSALVSLFFVSLILNYSKLSLDRLIPRPYFLFVFAIGFVGFFLSYTRGAMLGFLIVLPMIFYFYRPKIGKLVATISAILVALMVVISLLGGLTVSRFFISATNASNTIRISQYKAAWHAFEEKPLLGWGPQQLKYYVKDLKIKYNLEHQEYYGEHAHNIFLEILANTGIVGLLVFVLWLALWALEVLRGSTLQKQLFLPVIFFILVAGQVEMIMMAQTSVMIYFLYSLTYARFITNDAAATKL